MANSGLAVLLPQIPLEDFAHDVSRQLVDEYHRAGALEAGKTLVAVLDQLVFFHTAFTYFGQLTISGPDALEKARLACDIVWERLAMDGFEYAEDEKLIVANPGNPRGLPEREYFDVSSDPLEKDPYSDPEAEERLEEMAELQRMAALGQAVESTDVEMTYGRCEQLRVLGYVEDCSHLK